jgi:hypothetical protein
LKVLVAAQSLALIRVELLILVLEASAGLAHAMNAFLVVFENAYFECLDLRRVISSVRWVTGWLFHGYRVYLFADVDQTFLVI